MVTNWYRMLSSLSLVSLFTMTVTQANVATLTPEEIMARLIASEALAIATIWQEARGEDITGKVAVAEVILRRMKLRKHSDGTIEGTVLRDRQFSGWNNGDPNRIPAVRVDDDDPIVQDCLRAWNTAMAGSNFTNGATHYFNAGVVNPPWSESMTKTVQIGNHSFYREK